ncbi:MAG: peptide deformylase, partial [Selenomonadaceae bacterium]|nr:peptide deformylase [Selenomonadaceae bacterium]
EAEGLLGRCIQHELDHLDGQLFIDVAKNITKGRKEKNGGQE